MLTTTVDLVTGTEGQRWHVTCAAGHDAWFPRAQGYTHADPWLLAHQHCAAR